MKTAEEWRQELGASEEHTAMYDTIVIKLFRAIQLDAFKAGMTEAATLIQNRVPMLNNTYGDYIEKCLTMQNEIKDRILAARDAKTL